jgi:hypothetical protein
MDGLNFDPYVGQEVRVLGRPGVFRILHVYQPGEEHSNPNLRTPEGLSGTVDLKREKDGFALPAIPWYRLNYADETGPVYQAIEWLKTNPDDKKYPDYIVDYEVEARNDQSGNPSIFVRFLVEPDYFYENGSPSQRNMAALSEFTFEVEQVLLGLDLDRWIYVQSGVARRVLDVAS